MLLTGGKIQDNGRLGIEKSDALNQLHILYIKISVPSVSKITKIKSRMVLIKCFKRRSIREILNKFLYYFFTITVITEN